MGVYNAAKGLILREIAQKSTLSSIYLNHVIFRNSTIIIIQNTNVGEPGPFSPTIGSGSLLKGLPAPASKKVLAPASKKVYRLQPLKRLTGSGL